MGQYATFGAILVLYLVAFSCIVAAEPGNVSLQLPTLDEDGYLRTAPTLPYYLGGEPENHQVHFGGFAFQYPLR